MVHPHYRLQWGIDSTKHGVYGDPPRPPLRTWLDVTNLAFAVRKAGACYGLDVLALALDEQARFWGKTRPILSGLDLVGHVPLRSW